MTRGVHSALWLWWSTLNNYRAVIAVGEFDGHRNVVLSKPDGLSTLLDAGARCRIQEPQYQCFSVKPILTLVDS